MTSTQACVPPWPSRCPETYRAGSWLPVDPSSLADVAERHVVVARGRDYADVRPLSGVYSGPAAEHFGVTVEVTRLG